MSDWVRQVCDYGIPKIIFTGGEPFERFDCLSGAIAAAKNAQTPTAVFTSSYWASSPEIARTVLQQLSGLTHLYLSSDVYHQRNVPVQYVFNVIDSAFELCIKSITVNITYTKEVERLEVRRQYARYADRLRFAESRVIPNPFFSKRILENQDSLRAPRTSEYQSNCEIGTPLINPNGDVFSCHIGKAAAHRDLRDLPYFLGNLREDSFVEIMSAAAGRPDYQYLRTHGPTGVATLFGRDPCLISAVGRDGFTNECDMCFSTLKTLEGRQALARVVDQPQVLEEIDIRLAILGGEDPIM